MAPGEYITCKVNVPLEDVRVVAWSVLVDMREERGVAMIVPKLGEVIVSGSEEEKDKSETRKLETGTKDK